MTDKIFNQVSVVTGLVGGFFCKYLGGYDMLLKALVTLIALDYLTGLLKAIYTKTLSSEVGFKGLIKKVMILIVVAVAVVIQEVIGESIPIREIVILFFASNEGISLLENASAFIPIPDSLRNVLIQIRDKNNDTGTDKEEKTYE